MNTGWLNWIKSTSAGMALTGLLCLGACTRYHDQAAFLRDPTPVVTATEYRMAPPDQVLITSRRVRELSNHNEYIRPDGKLTLPLMGSVFVAGKTCEEVSAELQALAQEYYEDADINVRILSFNSKKIFVFGEVSSPGPYAYYGTNTILETLARAQPTRLADPGRIHILRPNKDGHLTRRMTIDLNAMVKRGDVAFNALLEEGDVIYVPANGLASVGLVLQQLLLPIQPAVQTARGPNDINTSLSSAPYSSSGNSNR